MTLGAFLDSTELTPPIPFEPAGPLVERSDRVGVGAIKNLPAITPQVDEADVAKHAKMLGDRRLRQRERHDDVPDRTLPRHEVIEDVAAAWFRDRVENVRGRGGARHDGIIFLYRNMSCQGPPAIAIRP